MPEPMHAEFEKQPLCHAFSTQMTRFTVRVTCVPCRTWMDETRETIHRKPAARVLRSVGEHARGLDG